MSLTHSHIVGHIDPLDPADTSDLPYRPKVVRPIPREAADRAVADFGADVAPFVSYGGGGYVLCHWSAAPYTLTDRLREFAQYLADREGAVALDDDYLVWWPPAAQQLQRRARPEPG
jgi:hypothetical protein